MELLVDGQYTIVGVLKRIGGVVFAEGRELGIEDFFEDLVAESGRKLLSVCVHGNGLPS